MRQFLPSGISCAFCSIPALLVPGLALGLEAATAVAQAPAGRQQPELLTNLFQLRSCAQQEPQVVHPFRIVADVVSADSASDVLVLRDASGVEFVHLDLLGQEIEPGATLCLEGKGNGVCLQNFGLSVVPGMAVDNDGIHRMTLKSGTTFLHAGTNPISLVWFNRFLSNGLTVEYEGPGLPRQPIPASVLSRAAIDRETGCTNYSAGLDYRCYEGSWGSLPDFGKYQPAKSGIVTNFDLGVRTRDESVGLQFNGFITVPGDGLYTFYLTSDDGSRLCVGDSSVDVYVLSRHPAPAVAAEVPATEDERRSRPWVTLEGTVTYAGVWRDGGEFQMRVGKNDIRVEVFKGGDVVPDLPPHSRVRVSGIYQDLITLDGTRVPGRLLVTSWSAVQRTPLPETVAVNSISSAGPAELAPADKTWPAAGTPAIQTAAEIKALSPEAAKQQLPVSIRGVVTAFPFAFAGAVVQDSTRGVFVDLHDLREPEPVQLGEFCQIEGVTGQGLVAPVVVARRITHLEPGQWPKPLRATWDQLMNGSLDNEYAEIEGVVTAIQDQRVVLLTRGGKITLNLFNFRPETLPAYQNALVRIRGCIFANFNLETRKLQAGLLSVSGADVQVLQPAPRDLFDAPQKSISQLLLYDAKAAPFRLLKVRGQIIHGQPGEYFLTDGTNGVRVTTENSNHFRVGELVDAVGFLELGGPAAELKEAVMRTTGRAPMPAPIRLAPEHLLQASYADLLVQADATLVNQWREGPEYLLELQSGLLAFRARINSQGRSISLPPSGSRLNLTGVYSPQGRGPGGGTVGGFELLLNSPADIRVLATPAWWTLKRMLVLAGILAALLCAVLVWNKQLQRKVQERGRQLEREIRNRQQAELRHAAEAERSRIARDLHDELGTGLTEVSLLASAGLGELRDLEKSQDRVRIIAEKARTLVSGLDVIVWAIDPKRNSLQSFADYVGSYAKELLAASNVVCRLKIPIECDAIMLTGPARHNLFLAIKEALNNAIRHASATEVELEISQPDHSLQVVIADNGRGFDWNTIQRGNGLANLQERLAALRGRCRIESQAGNGTTVKLIVPLPHDPGDSRN